MIALGLQQSLLRIFSEAAHLPVWVAKRPCDISQEMRYWSHKNIPVRQNASLIEKTPLAGMLIIIGSDQTESPILPDAD